MYLGYMLFHCEAGPRHMTVYLGICDQEESERWKSLENRKQVSHQAIPKRSALFLFFAYKEEAGREKLDCKTIVAWVPGCFNPNSHGLSQGQRRKAGPGLSLAAKYFISEFLVIQLELGRFGGKGG